MQTIRKAMIVTSAAQGIGAGVTSAFIERGYNVVANSLNITVSTFAATDRLAVVRGDIGDFSTAHEIASTAIKTDFEKLSGTNLQGLYQYHAARRQANADAKQWWERNLCDQRNGGASYRGH